MRVKLEQITKKFGQTVAVHQLSAELYDGELICLLGPSGCGKSTTLFILAGLEQPSAGKVYFDSDNVTALAPEERDIGMVFQNYALYPHMSVAENIAFPLKMRRVKNAERKARTAEMLELLHLEGLERRKPGQLSGGQQQRVALARALVKKPKLLLLDEPLSNLDARLRITLREEIRSLQQRLGITVVFVTHDQEEAMSISDRILLLNQGILQQYAPPKEMYNRPYNQFVAGFLGNPQMNFITGSYSLNPEAITINKHELIAGQLVKGANFSEGEVLVGIRPEDVFITEAAKGIPATVTSIQPLGKEIILRLAIGTTSISGVARWEEDFRLGQRVSLGFGRAYLFPATKQPREETL